MNLFQSTSPSTREFIFDDCTDGHTPLTQAQRQFIALPTTEAVYYSIYAINNSFVYMRLLLSDRTRPRVPPLRLYLKAQDPRFWLAFAMGSHRRLGYNSDVRSLPTNDDANVMTLIRRFMYGNPRQP